LDDCSRFPNSRAYGQWVALPSIRLLKNGINNMLNKQLWEEAWNEYAKDVDLSTLRVSGVVTKKYPDKEDANFWAEKGPEWVQSYIDWRTVNSNWKIWKTPQGVPAIELGIVPKFAGVPVKMVIDRIFDVDGTLVVVDLKTSKSTPTSSLQLGFYKAGIQQIFGVDIAYGNYWMARHSGTGSMVDLSKYTDEHISYFVEKFDKARKAGVFLPNTNNCNRCGLTEHCPFTSKKEK
jgi:putative RecB family exonuclease